MVDISQGRALNFVNHPNHSFAHSAPQVGQGQRVTEVAYWFGMDAVLRDDDNRYADRAQRMMLTRIR